jgi:hypothetical protein
MSDLTIQQVNSAIMFGDFTNEQLNSIAQAVKYRRSQIVKQQACILRPGDSVKFTSRGNTYFGTVEKIKIKNALVKIGSFSKYNVPMSMLEAV